jgi:hypothetical protein
VLALAVTLATPLAFVVAELADNDAEAPEPGTENVTGTPAAALLLASVTVTCNWLAN